MRFLHEKIWLSATAECPDRCAIVYQDKYLSYSQVWNSVSAFSNWLSNNIETGSRIAICLENIPEAVYSLYAIPAAGMIAVPIDANLHERNITHILNDAGAEVVITTDKQLGKLTKIIKNINLKTIIICGDKNNSFQKNPPVLYLNDLLDNRDNAVTLDMDGIKEEDTAVILYTTGTTGPKKGVMLSHFNLLSATGHINQFMQFDNGVIESLPMPLSHSFGFARLRSVFAVAGTVILENGLLRPELVLHHITRYKANSFSSVPAGFEILLNDYYIDQFRKVGRQLRFIEIGSAFMRSGHKKLLMECCPETRICMHFGLTEASRSTFIEFHSEKDYVHTAGRPSPNVSIKIVDKNSNALPINTPGEILIKADTVMKGYWANDKLTREVLKDGWLFTGDSGMIDRSGYLQLLGRKEDVINLGGIKVGPEEVESVLVSFPGISEAAVVGIFPSNGLDNQIIRAYLVVADKSSPVDCNELKRFCLRELEPYKVPQEFIILETLPKLSAGKIQRHLLREMTNGSFEKVSL